MSLTQCGWIKIMLLKYHEEDVNKGFVKLEDYTEELRKSNNSSSVILKIEKGSQVSKRIYIYFVALRKRFNVGYKHAIGLDGCFLIGSLIGETLSVIGRDINNQKFLVA